MTPFNTYQAILAECGRGVVEDARAYIAGGPEPSGTLGRIALIALDAISQLPKDGEEPPALEIDRTLAAFRQGGITLEQAHAQLDARQRIERRIAWNLIAHLERAGFKLHSINDGDELRSVSDPRDAMELLFNLDEASLRFWKPAKSARKNRDDLDADDWHGVLLIWGNGNAGLDCISDWNYSADDADGFNAAMDAFCDYDGAGLERFIR